MELFYKIKSKYYENIFIEFIILSTFIIQNAHNKRFNTLHQIWISEYIHIKYKEKFRCMAMCIQQQLNFSAKTYFIIFIKLNTLN